MFVEENLYYFMNVSCQILGDIKYSCLRLNHYLKGSVHSKMKNLSLFILFQTNPTFLSVFNNDQKQPGHLSPDYQTKTNKNVR